MEYVYAALLLHETDTEISEPNLSAVLEAAGEDVQTSRVKAIVAALEDVDLDSTNPEMPEETPTGVQATAVEAPGEDADVSTGEASESDPEAGPAGDGVPSEGDDEGPERDDEADEWQSDSLDDLFDESETDGTADEDDRADDEPDHTGDGSGDPEGDPADETEA